MSPVSRSPRSGSPVSRSPQSRSPPPGSPARDRPPSPLTRSSQSPSPLSEDEEKGKKEEEEDEEKKRWKEMAKNYNKIYLSKSESVETEPREKSGQHDQNEVTPMTAESRVDEVDKKQLMKKQGFVNYTEGDFFTKYSYGFWFQ